MAAMTLEETSEYLRHHAKLAGRSDTLFSDDAAALIHQLCRGSLGRSPAGRSRPAGHLHHPQDHRRHHRRPRRHHRGERPMTPPAPRRRDLAGTRSLRRRGHQPRRRRRTDRRPPHLADQGRLRHRLHPPGTRHGGHDYAYIDWERAITALDSHQFAAPAPKLTSCASRPASATPTSPSTSPASWADSTTTTSTGHRRHHPREG